LIIIASVCIFVEKTFLLLIKSHRLVTIIMATLAGALTMMAIGNAVSLIIMAFPLYLAFDWIRIIMKAKKEAKEKTEETVG